MKRHGRQEATVLLKAAAGVSRGFDLPTSYRRETRACRGVALLNASRPDTMNCAFAADFCRVWTPASFRCIQYSLLFTFIFVYLHGAESRRCCFFYSVVFESLVWLFFFLSPSLPPSLLSFSHCLSPFPLSVSFFLSRSPPSPLISLTLALLLSLPHSPLSFLSPSVPFISCAECSPRSTVFLLSIHSISSRFSQQKHFLPNILSNILSVTPMLNEGVIFYSGFGEPLFFASSMICVCARVSECDFSRMGCNQNTKTLKSRAQDHQGRDATLHAWDEDVRMELTREVFG